MIKEIKTILDKYNSIIFTEEFVNKLNESEDDCDLIEYHAQLEAIRVLDLNSKRLRIRNFTNEDLESLFECTSNKEMMISDGGKVDKQLDDAKKSLKYLMETRGKYAIEHKESSKMIGFISLLEVDDRALTSFDIGFSILPSYQRNGYATEAIRLLLDFAFLEMNLKIVTASHFIDNVKSKSILEKFGFVNEGIKRSAYYHPELMKVMDLNMYSLKKDEYKKKVLHNQ